ncbi:MAG TPA: SGNH/GDSL hydrolase family protein [Marisediminicola sp.]|nr:SGNH/GDSL hydrolase family protein [Marisediminicola sp.]
MPFVPRLLIVATTSVTLLTGAVLTGRHLVIRRRSGGMVRLAETIPVHSAYWREQHKKRGELLYVALGDSTAQGIGASRPGHSYVGVLARAIRRHTKRSVRVVNLSQSGARVREAVETLVPAFAKYRPDLVTVSIGANDIVDFEAERFERGLRELCAALPPAAIIADLPSFYYGQNQRRVKVANEIVRRVADEYGLAVAPLHRVTHRRTAARTALRDVASDFFHPNDRGYLVWASAFEPLLTAAIDRLNQKRL